MNIEMRKLSIFHVMSVCRAKQKRIGISDGHQQVCVIMSKIIIDKMELVGSVCIFYT